MIRKVMLRAIALLLMNSIQSILNASSAAPCDRECLKGFVTQYLSALTSHKPEALAVTPDMKFTEDCKEMKLGEGMWKSFSRLRDYRRDILDVRGATAVSFLVAEENDAPVLYVIRLKIENNKISEIESTAVRKSKRRHALKPAKSSDGQQDNDNSAGKISTEFTRRRNQDGFDLS